VKLGFNNMKAYKISYRYIILFVTYLVTVFTATLVFSIQDDTVIVNDVSIPPVIDGMGDDACWNNVRWQTIDQVWINYGEVIDSSDYYGRYKIIWSSKENLLYFLVEVVDDVAIGGFVQGVTADVYNYDIIEVFIDENKSGGPHINDNPVTFENAENAFGYHIYAGFPNEGEVTKEYWVGDIPIPHTDHLPEFALRKTGNVYTREFSLKVFNDTYEEGFPEASRVELTNGKIMGLSLAYCDNDVDDGQRDNFFGSVWVSEANYNNHWMNADDFGTVKLYSGIIPDQITETQFLLTFEVYPNPASDYISLKVDNDVKSVEIIDVTGKVVILRDSKSLEIPVSDLTNGIYYTKIICSDNIISFGKFLKL
jgi:hypothetical protein